MDKKERFLQKVGEKQAAIFTKLFQDISQNNLNNLDVKKLQGFDNVYRLRKGKWRIIFIVTEEGNRILEIGTRGDVY